MHTQVEGEETAWFIIQIMCRQTTQAWEIAKLMYGAAKMRRIVIGLEGPSNMVPSSFAHMLVHAQCPVRGAWQPKHWIQGNASSYYAEYSLIIVNQLVLNRYNGGFIAIGQIVLEPA